MCVLHIIWSLNLYIPINQYTNILKRDPIFLEKFAPAILTDVWFAVCVSDYMYQLAFLSL